MNIFSENILGLFLPFHHYYKSHWDSWSCRNRNNSFTRFVVGILKYLIFILAIDILIKLFFFVYLNLCFRRISLTINSNRMSFKAVFRMTFVLLFLVEEGFTFRYSPFGLSPYRKRLPAFMSFPHLTDSNPQKANRND